MFIIGRTSGGGTSGASSLSSTFHENPAFAYVICHSNAVCGLEGRIRRNFWLNFTTKSKDYNKLFLNVQTNTFN